MLSSHPPRTFAAPGVAATPEFALPDLRQQLPAALVRRGPGGVEPALHVAVEGGAEYQRENEPDPIVHRDVAVQSLSRLDPLKGRDRRPGTTTIAPGTGRVSTSWSRGRVRAAPERGHGRPSHG